MALIRWYISILSILLEPLFCCANAVIENCPHKCSCDGDRLICYDSLPEFIPRDTTEVAIHEAHLSDRLNFSDPFWREITHLTITVESKEQEAYKVIHENELGALQSLRTLRITCRCLTEIEKNAFRGLTNLIVLDLSENTAMSAEFIVQGLAGEDILPNLRELYLSNNQPVLGIVFNWVDTNITNQTGHEFLEAIKSKPLKVLDISRSKNDWFYWEYYIYIAFPYLEKLNISKTSTTESIFLNDTVVNTISLHLIAFLDQIDMHLKTIDISYPYMEFPLTSLTGSLRLYTYYFHLAPFNLTEIYAKGIIGYPSKVYGFTNASIICITFIHVTKEDEACLLTDRVKYIDKLVISDNSIRYFEPSLWEGFHALRYLDISKNDIGHAFSQDGHGKSILDKLINLEVFVVSENNITYIPAETFENCRCLKILDLAHNKLESITFRTDSLQSLLMLDLSYNKIKSLDPANIDRLNQLLNQPYVVVTSESFLTNRSSYSSLMVHNTSFQISFKGNPFVCACTDTNFVYWLEALNESDTCIFISEQKKIDKHSLRQIEYLCKEKIVITVFSIFAFVMIALLSIMFYLILKEFRKMQRRKGIYMGIELYKVNRDERHSPPVFLSFCYEDEEIAMDAIYPNLDLCLRNLLNTEARCVATGGTDFRPGYSLTNEIIRCVEASSVVVFFVTNKFCETLWCKNETLAAHYDKKPIVLMLWEEVDPKLMPKQLYKHFKEYARVHWIHENGVRVMKPDWQGLSEAIVMLFSK